MVKTVILNSQGAYKTSQRIKPIPDSINVSVARTPADIGLVHWEASETTCFQDEAGTIPVVGDYTPQPVRRIVSSGVDGYDLVIKTESGNPGMFYLGINYPEFGYTLNGITVMEDCYCDEGNVLNLFRNRRYLVLGFSGQAQIYVAPGLVSRNDLPLIGWTEPTQAQMRMSLGAAIYNRTFETTFYNSRMTWSSATIAASKFRTNVDHDTTTGWINKPKEVENNLTATAIADRFNARSILCEIDNSSTITDPTVTFTLNNDSYSYKYSNTQNRRTANTTSNRVVFGAGLIFNNIVANSSDNPLSIEDRGSLLAYMSGAPL